MGVVSCGTTMLDQGVFENIGSVTWDTIAKTSGFTAVSGNGYFCNTTSAAFTVTLPSSPSAGDVVGLKDYANTADTNNITIDGNGSNIQGAASNYVINTEGRSVILVYVDATKGWLVTGSAQASNIVGPLFVTATGGTITTCGDYKIHTFTGPGTFTVTCAGNPAGSSSVDYLVIAGGGGGGRNYGGGGGAGGYRESSGAASGCYSRSPLGACVSALPVTAQGYPITVGGGGAGGNPGTGTGGNPSVFSSITSTGGGGGGGTVCTSGNTGGSGGGGAVGASGGTGNSPPTSPSQGNNGGAGATGPFVFAVASGGGGGASAVGSQGFDAAPSGPPYGGPGGAGATSSINATPTTRAGGGGGASQQPSGGSGGSGGGGAGANNGAQGGTNATTNTGGGGGGGQDLAGGSGGSGIVIIRYKYQ
jgi:hypothetical protein